MTPNTLSQLSSITDCLTISLNRDKLLRLTQFSALFYSWLLSRSNCARSDVAYWRLLGKLCQWIVSDVIHKGGRLWTNCPATKVLKHQGRGNFRWNFQTPRGAIATETIVHCTNAYAAFLLPELSGVITPRRAQGHSYVPPASLSGENTLKSTMALRYGAKHFFSVNQLKDGTVILGGWATRRDEDWTPEFLQNRTGFDDTTHNPHVMESSIAEFSKLASLKSPTRAGEGFAHVWTGIVGETPDAVPFVGPVDGLDGQWICAGFNGHGMARIFQCAPGLVKLITGKPWSATGLPECFRFSGERLRRFDVLKAKV